MTDCRLMMEPQTPRGAVPGQLDFKEVTYWVTDSQGGRKTILSSVSGVCRPGNLLALMGPSGRSSFPSLAETKYSTSRFESLKQTLSTKQCKVSQS